MGLDYFVEVILHLKSLFVVMICSKYGPVREVRIPRQARRMFGFVSFVYPETVQLILSISHPHYIGSSRILVKPYKEKSTVNERYDFQSFNSIFVIS